MQMLESNAAFDFLLNSLWKHWQSSLCPLSGACGNGTSWASEADIIIVALQADDI